AFYEDARPRVILDTRIEHIDRPRQEITDARGERIAYGRLVLAGGSRGRRPDLPRVSLEGSDYLRNVGDVQATQEGMGAGKRLIIVGAGYIGLEVAAVAAGLGMEVTVLELLDRVMRRAVCPIVSDFYTAEHRARGVRILLDTAIEAFVGD